MTDAGPSLDLRSFGRRRGRKLSPRQQTLIDAVLPRIRVNAADPCSDLTRPIWLEIGFGGGEHLLHQAAANPAVTCIGCEPFEEGVAKVLTAVDARGLTNIRLHPDDARPLLRRLPDASIARIFVLFPDPWPKRKHQKRRLLSVEVLRELARILEPGGELRIGTDIPDYARTILMALQRVPELDWTARRPGDWTIRPDDWPQTRYETKAVREGRRSCYLLLRRRSATVACSRCASTAHAG
jgi:tRNA (guanine-N7-)-methyltransferase